MRKITFTPVKETPGTYVYEAPKGEPVRTIYIAKGAIKGEQPKKLTVTIAELEAA